MLQLQSDGGEAVDDVRDGEGHKPDAKAIALVPSPQSRFGAADGVPANRIEGCAFDEQNSRRVRRVDRRTPRTANLSQRHRYDGAPTVYSSPKAVLVDLSLQALRTDHEVTA